MNYRIIMFVLLSCATFIAQGCASLGRQDAVPVYLQKKAEVPGMPDVRYRAGNLNELTAEAIEAFMREKSLLEKSGHTGVLPPVSYLAISGGGDKGAFGAGLLVGWTAAGTRPNFKVVTGVSTGALIAPFAFLGPKYDAELKEVYTTISPKHVMKKRSLLAAIFSDALTDNKPLWKTVSKYVNQQMLSDIAAEYKKGRLLLVGTTDLDARQGVIWNMTKIAASKHPDSLDLFRKILLASAAIPAAFPPTMIDVEVAGQRYQEMHVDGGTVAQVFFYPPSLNISKIIHDAGGSAAAKRERTLYIIRNSRLDTEWAQVERKTMTIAGRAIGSLIHTQGRGDLFTIYTLTQRDGIDYNLSYIPSRFNFPHEEEFDQAFMNALFNMAYEKAKDGYKWDKLPPGLAA